jgi:hypothetical protein
MCLKVTRFLFVVFITVQVARTTIATMMCRVIVAFSSVKLDPLGRKVPQGYVPKGDRGGSCPAL